MGILSIVQKAAATAKEVFDGARTLFHPPAVPTYFKKTDRGTLLTGAPFPGRSKKESADMGIYFKAGYSYVGQGEFPYGVAHVFQRVLDRVFGRPIEGFPNCEVVLDEDVLGFVFDNVDPNHLEKPIQLIRNLLQIVDFNKIVLEDIEAAKKFCVERSKFSLSSDDGQVVITGHDSGERLSGLSHLSKAGAVSREDLQRYKEVFFTADNACISLSAIGSIPFRYRRLVEQHFDIPTSQRPVQTLPVPYTGGDFRKTELLRGEEDAHTHFWVGFPMPLRADVASQLASEIVHNVPPPYIPCDGAPAYILGFDTGNWAHRVRGFKGVAAPQDVEKVLKKLSVGLHHLARLSLEDDPHEVENRIDLIKLDMSEGWRGRRMRYTCDSAYYTVGEMSLEHIDSLRYTFVSAWTFEPSSPSQEEAISQYHPDDLSRPYGTPILREHAKMAFHGCLPLTLEKAVSIAIRNVKMEDVKAAAQRMLAQPVTFVALGNIENLPSPERVQKIFRYSRGSSAPAPAPDSKS